MNKAIIAAALFAAAGVASAQDYSLTGFQTYDYNKSNSGQPFASQHDGRMGIKGEIKNGPTVDFAGILGTAVQNHSDMFYGYEGGIGYTMRPSVFEITPRLGAGMLYDISTGIPGVWDDAGFYTAGVAIDVVQNTTVNPFANYKFRDGFSKGIGKSHLYQVGVSVALTDDLSVRVGLDHLRQGQLTMNGATAGIQYKF